MIRVHVFSWARCRWEWLWRPAAVVRAMRHLTLIGTLACTGITIVPPAPPVEAHGPPPAPPPKFIVETPPGRGFPPAWSLTPPAGTWPPRPTEIPLGPVVPTPDQEHETFQFPSPAGSSEVMTLRELVPVVGEAGPAAPTQICDTPPESKVSEPGMMGLFVIGLVLVGIWKALGYER